MTAGSGSGLERARTTCAFCPKMCRHACPAAEAERSEQATPTFKQQVALGAQTGAAPLDAGRARVLYKCTDCRATVDVCRHRIDVASSLREARADAVAAGVAPPEVGWLAERFLERGSPYSADLAARLEAACPGERASAGPTALLPSCADLAHDPDEVGRVLAALRRAGRGEVRPALPAPPCCGYPLDALGLTEAFRAQAVRFAVALSGFEQVVVMGPACARTLARRYAAVGVPVQFQVTPLVDLLAAAAPTWADERPAAGARLVYHGACQLEHGLARTAEPRAVLRAAAGREPLELGVPDEETLCSGGGGGYALTHPGPAASCAERVLARFREAGGEALVTACPTARRRLRRADPDVRVHGLGEVLAGAARLEP